MAVDIADPQFVTGLIEKERRASALGRALAACCRSSC